MLLRNEIYVTMSRSLHSNVSIGTLLCLSVYVVTSAERSRTHFIFTQYSIVRRYILVLSVYLLVSDFPHKLGLENNVENGTFATLQTLSD